MCDARHGASRDRVEDTALLALEFSEHVIVLLLIKGAEGGR